MSFQDDLLAALTRYAQKNMSYRRIKEVTGYEDVTRNDGYCETCWYEYAAVELKVIYENGTTGTEDIDGSFANLLRELTND